MGSTTKPTLAPNDTLQRLHAHGSLAVTKLRERRRGESDLGERR
jgi:hypothetical protein